MDIASIIIGTIGSGLVATIITLIVQRHSEIKKVKIEIFETLMAHRYLKHDKDNVEALNKIDVVFYNNTEVRKAWTEFLDAADRGAENPMANNNIDDKYLKLLEKIAIAIGYKNVNWENIKRYYFPEGLSNKISEETMLRKAQLAQVTAVAKQDSSSGQTTAEQFGMQFLLKALEAPDGLEKVARIAEMAGKPTKSGKR